MFVHMNEEQLSTKGDDINSHKIWLEDEYYTPTTGSNGLEGHVSRIDIYTYKISKS